MGLLESDASCGLCVGNVQPTLPLYPPFIFVPFTASAARAAAAHFPHSSSPAVLEGNTEGALGHITGFAVAERTAAATAVSGFQVVLSVPCNTVEGLLSTLLKKKRKFYVIYVIFVAAWYTVKKGKENFPYI